MISPAGQRYPEGGVCEAGGHYRCFGEIRQMRGGPRVFELGLKLRF